MSLKSNARRARTLAAGSPVLRKARSRILGRVSPPGQHGANASFWTIRESALRDLVERYGGDFPLLPASYGTVGDFADSMDNMPGLAGANFDMKDLQRCWMLKAILGNVDRGSRILEIGAGEPLVAGALSRIGYDVTVVDPYDGSGNGPREFETFRGAYPDVGFIREQFPPARSPGGDFSAIYSISVLEHVPLEAIDAVMTGARELLTAKAGCQIHAVDHVVAGWGAEEHREKLERIAAGMGVADGDLHEAIDQLSTDPETYFVSAESHNRWRGDLPYDQYPMRRIASVNLFAPVA
jgi:hypothetical protein